MDAEYLLNLGELPETGHDQIYLAARIRGDETDIRLDRSLLNLSVVLDRSGSMKGKKLAYVKQATQFLIRQLNASDLFSLVVYDNLVDVAIAHTPIGNHKDNYIQAIERIYTGGSTNLSGGWLKGCQLVSERLTSHPNGELPPQQELLVDKDEHDLSTATQAQVNRVLLLTDGEANNGITDATKLIAMARDQREQGIPTTTLGVGMGFNEDLLINMATEGGGNFYFIDDPDKIPQIFQNELDALAEVIAQNLTINLLPSEHIQFVRQLNNYPTDSGSDGIGFRLGDVIGDETKTLILEFNVPPLSDLGELEIAKLRFEYDEIKDNRAIHQTVEIPVTITVVSTEDFTQDDENAEVKQDVLRLQAGQARREAINLADKGQYKQASEVLNNTADLIESSKLDHQDLKQEHDLLREEAADYSLGAKRYDAHTRKTSSTVMYHTQTLTSTFDSTIMARDLRQARDAMERSEETPKYIRWDGQSLEITKDALIIGRGDECDIILKDDSTVSRRHCMIVRDGDDLYLKDLGSRNGTYANRGHVKTDFRLSVGDVISIGNTLFRLTNKAQTSKL